MNLESEAMRNAIADLRRRLDAGAIEALRSGMDWAEGPVKDPDPLRWMKPFDLFQPMKLEMEVKAGPVEPGTFMPTASMISEGWRLIRHEDWVKAGRPGDTQTVLDVTQPRCGCDPEVARRVIVEHGTCHMGGCPYGGDV